MVNAAVTTARGARIREGGAGCREWAASRRPPSPPGRHRTSGVSPRCSGTRRPLEALRNFSVAFWAWLARLAKFSKNERDALSANPSIDQHAFAFHKAVVTFKCGEITGPGFAATFQTAVDAMAAGGAGCRPRCDKHCKSGITFHKVVER